MILNDFNGSDLPTPNSKMVVEDVRFNHFKSKAGKWFSLVEIGKSELYRFIKVDKCLGLELVQGYDTHRLRNIEYGADHKGWISVSRIDFSEHHKFNMPLMDIKEGIKEVEDTVNQLEIK
jgi:hypothetical protein